MLFHRRTLAWGDIAHIYVRRMISRGVPTDTIRVRPRRGLPLQLAAPKRGGVMNDPDFDAKLGEIESRWIANGGRFIQRRRLHGSMTAAKYTAMFDTVFRAQGIEALLTPPRASPPTPSPSAGYAQSAGNALTES
jgi:hypothetical protein